MTEPASDRTLAHSDFTPRLIDTSAGSIEVAAAGSGPALLVLHGAGGSWRQFLTSVPDIEDRTLILVSRPGYGRTPITTGRTPEEQADVAAEIVGALGFERAAVLGISAGGPAALAFAERHPSVCTGVVLGSAVAIHLADTSGTWPAMIPGVLSLYLRHERRRYTKARAGSDEIATWMQTLFTADEVQRYGANAQFRNDIDHFIGGIVDSPLGARGMKNDLVQTRRATQPAPIGHIDAPALVLHGTSDDIVDVAHAEYHASHLRNARLELFESTRHMMLLSRRSEVGALMNEFLLSTN